MAGWRQPDAAWRPGLFPPDAVIRRVNGEAVLLLGGGRALLMQLAHPLVARAVNDHSSFRTDPFTRLQRTLDTVYTIVFGSEAQALEAASALAAVHERVRGPGYRASDPELLLWVHATLVDTALRVHRRFLGGLRTDEVDRYYAEAVLVGELLGVPRSVQPPDFTRFRGYVRTMVGSLEVTGEARDVARAVLHPRLPWPVVPVAEPLAVLGRQLTVGLLPPPLRRAYGLSWDPGAPGRAHRGVGRHPRRPAPGARHAAPRGRLTPLLLPPLLRELGLDGPDVGPDARAALVPDAALLYRERPALGQAVALDLRRGPAERAGAQHVDTVPACQPCRDDHAPPP